MRKMKVVDYIVMGISLLALIISILSYLNSRVLSHQHISPEIRCKLEFPFTFEKGSLKKQINNTEITITNTGPIKVAALTVDFKLYDFDKKSEAIVAFSELKQEPQGHFIFLKELQPSDYVKKQLQGVIGKDIIVIYAFTLKYYRENDMKMFDQQDIFFIEDYKIFPHKDYLNNDNYLKTIRAVESFNPTSNTSSVNLQAVDNHTWAVTANSETGIFIMGPNGKSFIIGGISEDPRALIKRDSLNINRPLLYVTPTKFKKTGTYINAEIIDKDKISIGLMYEVENIGENEAINISCEGGASFSKSLKQGEKTYFNSKTNLIKKNVDKQSPHDLINEIEKQDYTLFGGCTIVYFQKSDNKEFMTRIIYKIGKYNIQLVKYEIR